VLEKKEIGPVFGFSHVDDKREKPIAGVSRFRQSGWKRPVFAVVSNGARNYVIFFASAATNEQLRAHMQIERQATIDEF